MRYFLLQRRLIWAVLCAVCFATLAPSVSALLAARGRTWVEVCTAQGAQMRLLPVSGHQDLPEHQGSTHCPYCLLHADLATPPVMNWTPTARPEQQVTVRWQVHVLPFQAVAWAHLPSRAPPSLA